jgi:hypothetical protein
MKHPSNREEYNARFHAKRGDRRLRSRHRVIEVEERLSRPHHCGGCGRSAKMVVERSGSALMFEFVQTGGDPQPDWLVPKMRRVDE